MDRANSVEQRTLLPWNTDVSAAMLRGIRMRKGRAAEGVETALRGLEGLDGAVSSEGGLQECVFANRMSSRI